MSIQNRSEPPASLINTIVLGQVKSETEFGVFVALTAHPELDDVLIPKQHLLQPLTEQAMAFVYLHHEAHTDRILGSTKFHHYLPESVDSDALSIAQSVSLKVYAVTDLGFKVIVDDAYLGLLFHSDALDKHLVGATLSGFIKHIREDGKIDVCEQVHNRSARNALETAILEALNAHNGILTITDKSRPEEIKHAFNVSKASYKRALGALYKQQLIRIEPGFIKLINK
jgi:predicted RNA-binding protein (virulence factor B family)